MSIKVAVIDYDADVREVVECCLELVGYEVYTFNSLNVFSSLLRLQPDLIILDPIYRIGEVKSLLQKIRGTRETSDIPVLAYSVDYEIESYIQQLEVTSFLRKPCEISRFLTLIDGLVSRRVTNENTR